MQILRPTVALVALVCVVCSTLLGRRLRHMCRTPPSAADFADDEAALRYFRSVEMPANNLANLFEMPVLYFELAPLLILTGKASYPQVALAWAFVAARVIHSFIHIGPKKVQWRFFTYLASVIMLMAVWIGFLVDIAHAARDYHRVMDAMGGVL